MPLGETLRQARQEAGLSQKALCQGIITRNMLSQIENGTAKPSMATLQQLAARLGRPVSYFLGEEPAPVRSPLCEAVTHLERARHFLEAGKIADAKGALSQALEAQPHMPDWIRRQYTLLQARLVPEKAGHWAQVLPPLDEELLLRAQAALDRKDHRKCLRLLDAAEGASPRRSLLQGQALLGLGEYEKALPSLLDARDSFPHLCFPALETCYRELKDYEQAYFCACRIRELIGRSK